MSDISDLEHSLAAFIRAFGLHQGERTPCGVDLSVSEAHALVELRRTGGLSQSELVSFLRLEKSTVSRLVLGLEKRGWLSKAAHPTDRRAHLLILTEIGKQKAVQVAEARRAKFEALENTLPKDKRAAVLAALSTLTEALHEVEALS